MRNPFKRLGNPYSRRTPEEEPLEGHPSSFPQLQQNQTAQSSQTR
jgi:hypothetical protein